MSDCHFERSAYDSLAVEACVRGWLQVSPVVQHVISSQLQQLLDGSSVQQYQQLWQTQHSRKSLPHLAAAAEAAALLDPQQKDAAARLIIDGEPLTVS